MTFPDRSGAGEKLSEVLASHKEKDVVIFALPRGGVVLGKKVAEYLNAPLDLLIPRKIGHPDNPEYAIASVTEKGAVVKNRDEVNAVDRSWFEQEVKRQRIEAARRREKYLKDRRSVDVKNKIAIVVDDGIATGLTLKAAIEDLRSRGPKSIIIAVPVAPRDTVQELERLVDKVIVLELPGLFLGSIGAYYGRFDQVSDEEVIKIMKS